MHHMPLPGLSMATAGFVAPVASCIEVATLQSLLPTRVSCKVNYKPVGDDASLSISPVRHT